MIRREPYRPREWGLCTEDGDPASHRALLQVLAIRNYEAKDQLLQADAMNNLVYLRMRRGRATHEDVVYQHRAIAMSRETPAKLDTLGRVCDATGDRECALEAFGRLAATDEEVPPEARRHAQDRVEALKREAGSGAATPKR